MRNVSEHNDPVPQETEAPVLYYAGTRPPNPMARRSMWCGAALLLIFLLMAGSQRGLIIGGNPGMVLMILIYLSWPALSVAATIFGIIGYRRAKHSGLGGADEAGLGLAAGVLGIAITLLMTMVIIALNRQYGPDGKLNRIKCTVTLRHIGSACAGYAKEHGEQYPSRLDQLYTDCDLTPRDFLCPATEDTPASGNSDEEVVAALNEPGHCSYVYVGAGLTLAAPADAVVAYERLENHAGKGMHVLYVDGQVDWLDAKAAKLFMDKLKTRMGEPTTAPAG